MFFLVRKLECRLLTILIDIGHFAIFRICNVRVVILHVGTMHVTRLYYQECIISEREYPTFTIIIHVSQFTHCTPAHSHVAFHRHEYDYKGHDLEQELLHSSIVSRILSLDITRVNTRICMHI